MLIKKLNESIRLCMILHFLALVIFIPALCCYPFQFKPADQIILITLDTTRADHLGCYGYQNVETPNIDGIASDGILFENAICHVPITLPSHATIMTGLYPPEHGARTNIHFILPESCETLAEILKKEGYKTSAIVSAMPLVKKFGIAQGFDDYDDSFFEEFLENMIFDRRAGESIELANKWIEENKNNKFFFWLHLYDPHALYDPPSPFYEKYKGNLYDGEIAYMDYELGKFISQLKELQIYDDALIIIAGDHGEGLKDHGETEHQFLLYDSTVKVPLIVKEPHGEKGKEIYDLVGLIDIFPTVIDYCSIKPKKDVNGRSLKALIGKNKTNNNASYYIESVSGDITFGWSSLYAVSQESWKYIESPEPELYNLSEDPEENKNLIFLEEEQAKKMKDALKKMQDNFIPESEAPEAKQVLDEETLKALASLGYIGDFSSGNIYRKSDKNPKDLIDIERIFIYICRYSGTLGEKILENIHKMLEIDPGNKFALLKAGNISLDSGNYDTAKKYYEELISNYPELDTGYVGLSKTLLLQRNWNELMNILDVAISSFPENYNFLEFKALAQMEMGNVLEAQDNLRKALAVKPDEPVLYMLLSKAYALSKDEDQSVKYLKLAIEKGFKDIKFLRRDPIFTGIIKNHPEIFIK